MSMATESLAAFILRMKLIRKGRKKIAARVGVDWARDCQPYGPGAEYHGHCGGCDACLDMQFGLASPI